jgi:hypothetical protein
VAAVLAAATLLAGGCTQNSQTAPNGHDTSSASPQGSGSGAFGGRTPDGVQLGQLLTHAQLPAGWVVLSGGGNPEQDSGSSLQPAVGPQPDNDGCSIVNASATALYFTNWWSVSSASLSIQGAGAASGSIMSVTIAAYQPSADAGKTLSMAAHVAASCPSFTDKTNEKVTVSSGPGPQIGSQSLYIRATEQTSDGPIVAQVLLAQVGSYVVGVDTDNATSDDISQATLDSVGSWLAGLVHSG